MGGQVVLPDAPHSYWWGQTSIYGLSYNWTKPWSSSLLHATYWRDLCNSRLGQNILLRVTQIQVSHGRYTRFLGLGVSSVERELRELISNPDDPPVYLRGSFRSLAQIGTWLLVKNILRISQCLWEPQILAKHAYSSHRQRSLLAMVLGKIIPIIPVFCLLFKAYHTYTSFRCLKTIYKLPSPQNLHGFTNPYSHDL